MKGPKLEARVDYASGTGLSVVEQARRHLPRSSLAVGGEHDGCAPSEVPAQCVGLNVAVGGPELCAWQPARGVVWVQTRSARHARRLGQRRDGRLVARGVSGGYLRTYEFRRSMAWAVRLMKRYEASETATNERLGREICPRTNPAPVEGIDGG